MWFRFYRASEITETKPRPKFKFLFGPVADSVKVESPTLKSVEFEGLEYFDNNHDKTSAGLVDSLKTNQNTNHSQNISEIGAQNSHSNALSENPRKKKLKTEFLFTRRPSTLCNQSLVFKFSDSTSVKHAPTIDLDIISQDSKMKRRHDRLVEVALKEIQKNPNNVSDKQQAKVRSESPQPARKTRGRRRERKPRNAAQAASGGSPSPSNVPTETEVSDAQSPKRKPLLNADIEKSTLLSFEEKEFCARFQVATSEQYLEMKNDLIDAIERSGYFSKNSARRHVKGVDSLLLANLHEFLEDMGDISK